MRKKEKNHAQNHILTINFPYKLLSYEMRTDKNILIIDTIN